MTTTRKTGSKPLMINRIEEVTAEVVAAPTPSRPVLLESDVWRKQIYREAAEVAGKIDLIDASEIQAQRDHDEAVRMMTEKRDAERQSVMHRRDDLCRIKAGCAAALNASDIEAV